jgi:iron-sulfur cluster insertion protein
LENLKTREARFLEISLNIEGSIMSEAFVPVNFTDNAAAKVKSLLVEENNPDLKLRVYITGGGCSGFQYGFTFDPNVNEDDTTVEKEGVQLLIDSMSFQYLAGAKIDYLEDLSGARFVIENPNATSTCGCGSSFSV